MKTGTGVNTDPDLKALAKNLRAADKQLPKQLAKVNQRAAEIIAGESRANAASDGGLEAKAAPAIKASAAQGEVRIVVAATSAHPYALVAFLGAQRHTGWYSDSRYDDGHPQHPAWIGDTWVPGETGGPYAINQAIRDRLDDMLEAHGQAVDDFVDQAFASPGGDTE